MSTRDRALVAAAACLVLTAVPRPAGGQQAPPVAPGAHVRVTHDAACCTTPQVGSLVLVNQDAVVLRKRGWEGDVWVAIPRGAVRSLDLARYGDSYTWPGALIGGLAGLVGGAASGIATDCQDDEICRGLKPAATSIRALGGAAIGAFLGGFIGTVVRRREWVQVPVPAAVGPAPAGAGGVAVRFALHP